MSWPAASQRVLLVLAAALLAAGVIFGGRSVRTPQAVPVPDDPALAVRLDLNAATAADLETLPGVGPSLAGRIVTFRDEHGPFRSADDIRRVPGISEKLANALIPYLTTDNPPQARPAAPKTPSM